VRYDRRVRLLEALISLAALSGACATRTAPPAARPNILVVVTDDQRFDALGIAGNPVVTTPAIDALARDGVRFTNAFVTTAICAASRASILSGRYESAHRYSFRTPPLARRFTDSSYPRLLRAAGYHTGFIGKLGVTTEPEATVAMFDHFEPTAPPYLPPGETRHLTDRVADKAVAFLRTRPRGAPFCLSLSFDAPHAEDDNPGQYVWATDLDGLYDDVAVPPPANAEPEFFARQPEFLRTSLNRVRWGWRFDTEEKRVRMTRGYYRMIFGVDRALARIRAELDTLGLADDTVIVFTSDNGYFLGERGFAGKWLMYEESIRVPLIVADPRLPQQRRGTTCARFALNVDLAPTVLELAGLRPPAAFQGRSLAPLLAGEPAAWRSDFYYEHRTDLPAIPKSEGVRTARWKYLRYFEQDPVHEELYDLERDPHERVDLSGDPAAADLLARLRARCAALRAAAAAP
jgi:arylsulfatase A-like enzyme